MVEYIKENWFGLVMYGLFGVVLAMAGVPVLEKPLEFLLLLAILITVDLHSYKEGMKKGVQ